MNLEINLTQHCNLNCAYCLRYSPIAETEYMSFESFKSDIDYIALFQNEMAKAKFKVFNHIKLLGGEPLLHPQFCEFIRYTRQKFSKEKISLWTNGILLNSMGNEFWDCIKSNNIVICISEYPPIKNIKLPSNIAVEKTSRQQMYIKRLDTSGGQDAEYNYKNCGEIRNCITLENGKLYYCSRIPCVRHLNKHFGTNFEVATSDYIELKDLTIYKLIHFLYAPAEFCKYCCLLDGYHTEWKQSQKQADEWLK